MAIDWDKLDKDIDDVSHQSAQQTDERLAAKISAITRLTDEEIMTLFPKPADVQKLANLMRIVKSAEMTNAKVNNIVANIENYAGVIVTLLSKFA